MILSLKLQSYSSSVFNVVPPVSYTLNAILQYCQKSSPQFTHKLRIYLLFLFNLMVAFQAEIRCGNNTGTNHWLTGFTVILIDLTYVLSKRRNPITHWCSATFQKNSLLVLTSQKTHGVIITKAYRPTLYGRNCRLLWEPLKTYCVVTCSVGWHIQWPLYCHPWAPNDAYIA